MLKASRVMPGISGMGISYDRYDDESGGKAYDVGSVSVTLPSDNLTQEELTALNGEVRVYKMQKEDKHDNFR